MNDRSIYAKQTSLFLAFVYVAVTAVTFYSDSLLPKTAGMLMIPIAAMLFMIFPDVDRLKKLYKLPLLMVIGVLVIYMLSVFVWIVNTEVPMYIMTGTKRTAFQIVNICVAFCAVYIFGSKAVDLTLYGAFIMNGIFVVRGIATYGIAHSVADLLTAVKTGKQLGFMQITEINQITYVFGFFILYYLFISDQSRKKKALLISGCVFFIITGFKRINIFSVTLAVICAVIFFALSEKRKKPYMYILSAATALGAFCYIPFIRSGQFGNLMNSLHIETNTRIQLYDFIRDQYEFRPGFIGHGIDYVMRYLEYLRSIHAEYKGSSLKYIHNDILVKYIETGFFGFCGWLYAMCIYGMRWMKKNCGVIVGGMYAVLMMCNFINFSVGNTNHDYCVRLVIEVILFGTVSKCLIEDRKKEVKVLNG